jgi:hypothetical protein
MCHGFHVNFPEQLEPMLAEKGSIDGFVFQVEQSDKPLECIREISEFSTRKGFKALANVRLSSEDPAEFFTDDDYVASRTAEAVIAAYAYPNVKVFLDTFMDHDRGYFPRVGLYDRRINPRKGAHLVRNLNNALQIFGSEISVSKRQAKPLLFNTMRVSYQLHAKERIISPKKESTLIDLITGEINSEKDGDWILEINGDIN